MNNNFDFSTLHIDNPCPMVLALLNGEKAPHYYCGSCKKNVIDFTDCSQEEIKTTLTHSNGQICGVFREEQLQGQHRVKSYTGIKKIAFYALMILAIIGFNVTPMSANPPLENSISEAPPEDKEKEKKKKKKKRKRRWKGRRMMGCPAF